MKAKQEIKTGFKWSFIGFFFQKGFTLISGIILARLLTPEEFGLIGMATVFVGLFQVLVDSGFGYTIVRVKELNSRLLNSSLVFNFLLGLVFGAIFYLSAPIVADFFRDQALIPVVEMLSLVIVINALRVVPISVNIRELRFKERAKVDVISNVVGGIVGITMALLDYGVVSLIAQILVSSLVTTIAHNVVAKIKYKFEISLEDIKLVWKTSQRIFFSSVLSTIFNNLNNIVIGRYFPASELGYYNRAKSFQKIVQNSTVQMTQRSIFPVFAKIESLSETLTITRETVKKLCIIAMPLILVLFGLADNLIIALLTEKWSASILYLQLLAVMSVLYVPQMVYINVLKANDDKLFFISENISKVLRLTLLISSIPFGVKGIITGQIIQVLTMNLVSGYYLAKLLPKYSILNQIKDYIKPLLVSAFLSVIIHFIGKYLQMSEIIELIIQLSFFGVFYLIYSKMNNINFLKFFK